jgi:hypothetical protein
MGFYRWRLRISMAAPLQSPQVVAHEQEYCVSPPMRPRRFCRRLIASVAFLRSTMATLVALAMGVLISMSPTGLADTLDAPGQFTTLGVGSAPCFTVIKAVGKTAHFKEADSQAMLAWAQGYLSFYNSVSEGTYDVTGGAGADALQEWLSEFCRKNPQAFLMNAADELMIGGVEQTFLKPIRE